MTQVGSRAPYFIVTHKACDKLCPPPEGWLPEAVRVASFGGGGLAFGTG